MAEIENIRKSFNDWKNADNELYNVSVDYIKDRLSSLPNNEIYFDQDVSPIGIRHYNNGVVTFRLVNRVYLIDGDIYADIEGVDLYEITDAENIDLYNISCEISKY